MNIAYAQRLGGLEGENNRLKSCWLRRCSTSSRSWASRGGKREARRCYAKAVRTCGLLGLSRTVLRYPGGVERDCGIFRRPIFLPKPSVLGAK